MVQRRGRKKQNIRTPKRVDEKYTGPEPTWENWEKLSVDDFMFKVNQARFYYNYFHTGKDLKPQLLTWMKNNDYSAKDIKAVKSSPDSYCTTSIASTAICLSKGMPSTHPEQENWLEKMPGVEKLMDRKEWLKEKIQELIDLGNKEIQQKQEAEEEKPKIEKPVVSVIDRVREQCKDVIDDLDAILDLAVYQADMFAQEAKQTNVMDILQSYEVSQVHARVIAEHYAPILGEYDELLGKNVDQQLKEAYSSYKKKDIQALRNFVNNIIEACGMIQDMAKAKRKPKARKAPSKEKLVAKMRYCASNDTYKVVSINPVNIVGAKTVWLFNTKTKKLGKVVADEQFGQLSVQNNKIVGYDEKNSVFKNLRKPTEQLAQFKEAGKIKLRKFMDEINSVPIQFNGRMNEHMVILRADS